MENLAELVISHQDSLFAYLYRMCGDPGAAEDLMQETFVRALRASERYRPTASVRTWLFSIATNLVRDRWRRQSRRGEEVPLDDLPLTATEDGPEEQALQKAEAGQVRAALLLLSLEQRTALVLRYYHDLSYEEIARVMVSPIGTVRSRIHNGLTRLQHLLLTEEVHGT